MPTGTGPIAGKLVTPPRVRPLAPLPKASRPAPRRHSPGSLAALNRRAQDPHARFRRPLGPPPEGRPSNTEDKLAWVRYGEVLEQRFIETAQALGYDIRLNPEKSRDPTVPDLLWDSRIADLKQNCEPFFKSRELYGVDPGFVWSFNLKDFDRYTRLYPGIRVLFWSQREACQAYGVSLPALKGCWTATLDEIRAQIETGTPVHEYIRRRSLQDGNATASYLLDLRKFDCLWKE
jgi:hypothetical protein